MKTQVLARDKLKTQTNQMFTVLYDVLLYGILPIAFEMSYIRILKKSMYAFSGNDVDGISRLLIYFIVQWFLSFLVKKEYLRQSFKKVALGFLLFTQLQQFIVADVMLDLGLSLIAESGVLYLLFLEFSDLSVMLSITGLVGLLFVVFSQTQTLAHKVTSILKSILLNFRFMRNIIRYHMIPQKIWMWNHINCSC